MKTSKVILGVLLSLLIVITSCRKFDDVENLNTPDTKLVLSDPDDLLKLTGSIVNNWFQATQEYTGLATTMWVGADWGTCSWGGMAMKDFSSEPRSAWNNDPAYAYSFHSRYMYKNLYKVLTDANNILTQIIANGVEIGDNGETEMVEAIARLGQGLALGYLGLIYDKGFIVDETTDKQVPIAISPYMNLINEAISHLDQCIAVCNNNTFTLPLEWIPGNTWTNVEIGQLANSMSARLLVSAPRNKTENDATDWTRVKEYAHNGIDFDFAPLADDIVWYSLYHTYTIYSGWGLVDMRVIHMMDTNMPDYFPYSGSYDDLPNHGVASSDDARLESDFEYLPTCNFKRERGTYHFSCYRYSRLDKYLETWTEPMPEMLKAENDLMLAEAELTLGNKAESIDIINAGTRVSRGALAPLAGSISDAKVEEAIMYERTIELFLTSCGLPFFDMRRKDMLQKGTPLHFPIPGEQLEVMMIPNYTFGGVSNADGINTSNGGWNSKRK